MSKETSYNQQNIDHLLSSPPYFIPSSDEFQLFLWLSLYSSVISYITSHWHVIFNDLFPPRLWQMIFWIQWTTELSQFNNLCFRFFCYGQLFVLMLLTCLGWWIFGVILQSEFIVCLPFPLQSIIAIIIFESRVKRSEETINAPDFSVPFTDVRRDHY